MLNRRQFYHGTTRDFDVLTPAGERDTNYPDMANTPLFVNPVSGNPAQIAARRDLAFMHPEEENAWHWAGESVNYKQGRARVNVVEPTHVGKPFSLIPGALRGARHIEHEGETHSVGDQVIRGEHVSDRPTPVVDTIWTPPVLSWQRDQGATAVQGTIPHHNWNEQGLPNWQVLRPTPPKEVWEEDSEPLVRKPPSLSVHVNQGKLFGRIE